MPFLDVDGVALHYDDCAGGQPIVLLHGFTSSFHGTWVRRGWVDFLAENGFKVIGLDFRSHGQSDPIFAASECTTETLVADVVRLLDHLEVERTHLFGFSMGGGIALKLAMDAPERVNRIVVSGVGDAALNRFHDLNVIHDVVAAFEAESANAITSPTAQALRRNAEAAGNDLLALAPFLRNGGWPGGIEETRPISAPVLLVVADEDQYMAEVDELIRWMPHARVQRVRPADHYTVLDEDAVRAGVLAFFGEQPLGNTSPP